MDVVNGEEGQKIGLQWFYGLSLRSESMDYVYGLSVRIESMDWVYGLSVWIESMDRVQWRSQGVEAMDVGYGDEGKGQQIQEKWS